MALFMKQDFSPPLLSRRWVAIKLRPNMLIYSRDHIISILESGLLFREDCVAVEQETPSEQVVWDAAGGGIWGFMTRGEQLGGAALVLTCLLACPPKDFQRSTLVRLGACALLPVGVRALHRRKCRGRLTTLLGRMLRFVTLSRRSAALCREYAALHAGLDSLSAVIESTHTMLCRQQSALSVLMSRASSAILGNTPWLNDDVAWDFVPNEQTDNLQKIHHAFLVVQSTFLKHVAMSHIPPPTQAKSLYKNHNERVHWIHTVLLEHISEVFEENLSALERMYRLLKNYGSRGAGEVKKPGRALTNQWLYSDMHNDIARASLELKLASTKCDNIDVFLDACATNNQEIDPVVLNRDIDDLIDILSKCLSTTQNSQIRLKKLTGILVEVQDKTIQEDAKGDKESEVLVQIEDRDPEAKDEVFYFVRTDEDEVQSPADDVTTGPGVKEREATRVVLNELKRKLVKREDVMRERERKALAKTMPELRTLPEFPRQIQIEEVVDRRGFISKVRTVVESDDLKPKIRRRFLKKKPFPSGCSLQMFGKGRKFRLKFDWYTKIDDIPGYVCEANRYLKSNTALITIVPVGNDYFVVKWSEKKSEKLETCLMRVSESAHGDNEADNLLREPDLKTPDTFRVSKKDLELSSSGSESEFDEIPRNEILEDLRRHRARRMEGMRCNSGLKDDADESLRPIEYSLGTGLAMASVLQINRAANRLNMAEEEYVGDGEVSEDSGNDDD